MGVPTKTSQNRVVPITMDLLMMAHITAAHPLVLIMKGHRDLL
jgi:hypothetical protein